MDSKKIISIIPLALLIGCWSEDDSLKKGKNLDIQEGSSAIEYQELEGGIDVWVFDVEKGVHSWVLYAKKNAHIVSFVQNGDVSIDGQSSQIGLSQMIVMPGEIKLKINVAQDSKFVILAQEIKTGGINGGLKMSNGLSQTQYPMFNNSLLLKIYQWIVNKTFGEWTCSKLKDYIEFFGYSCPWDNDNILICPAFYIMTCDKDDD